MRTVALILCLCLMSAPVFGQIRTVTEPPVFDKKFWTVTGILIGSSIVLTETAVYRNENDRAEDRLKIYTVHGISDLLIVIMSANLKSEGRKWWWVPAISASAVNGSFAVSYSKSF